MIIFGWNLLLMMLFYFFVGGQTKPFSPEYLNDMYMFDTSTLKWTKIQYRRPPSAQSNSTNQNKNQEAVAVPCPRAGHSISLINSHVFMFGGFGDDGHHHSDLWVFSPITLSWQEVDIKPEERPGARFY
jgi:N-acetylneuraminic acid mutarotase